ncbi:tyrosine-type recombinase/integrase [Ruicaihuangia caeni]|uniref:tyrosine-type recombinase/integrase n=1 Tax=Ruicaihuangia caeni TaxID=3042517 RepID=UPI00338E7B01
MIERRTLRDGTLRWKARVKSGGRVVAQQTFARKSDAEAWEREQYRALHLGVFLPPSGGKTSLHEVVERFLDARKAQVSPHSYRTDRDNLAALPATLRARPIASVDSGEVLAFLTAQLHVKAHSTVARLKTTLSALFSYAVRERLIPANPVIGVRLPAGASQKPADEWFTAESLASTLRAQYSRSPHYASISEWLALTGLRWSEARALRVADLQDIPFPGVRVTRAHSDGYAEKAPKSRRSRRTVPLTNRALEIANHFRADKQIDDYLFTTKTGKQLRMNLFRRYAAWSDTAPNKRVHMLRHYAASSWLRSGVPINQVAAWLGDDPRTVLSVYAHVLGEQQDLQALRRLNALASGPSQDPGKPDITTPSNTQEGETPEFPRVFSGDGGI